MPCTKSSRDVPPVLAQGLRLIEKPEGEHQHNHQQDRGQDQDSAPIGPAAARLGGATPAFAAVARPAVLAFAAVARPAGCGTLDVGLGEGQALRPPAVGHGGLCRRLLVDDVTCLEVEVEVDTVGQLEVGGWGFFHNG
jgi:hypothetical protein